MGRRGGNMYKFLTLGSLLHTTIATYTNEERQCAANMPPKCRPDNPGDPLTISTINILENYHRTRFISDCKCCLQMDYMSRLYQIDNVVNDMKTFSHFAFKFQTSEHSPTGDQITCIPENLLFPIRAIMKKVKKTNLGYLKRGVFLDTKVTVFPKNLFAKARYWANLTFDGNEFLSDFDTKIHGMRRLEEIALENNPKLDYINGDTFKDVPNLYSISISRNRLSSIPEELFFNIPRLETLYLAGNRIRSIPEKTFSKNSQLRFIDLHENQLARLDPLIFKGLNNLEELVLAKNQLATISGQVFFHLPHIEIFDAASNKLTTFPKDVFLRATALRELYLEENPMINKDTLDKDIFNPLPITCKVWWQHCHYQFCTAAAATKILRGNSKALNAAKALDTKAKSMLDNNQEIADDSEYYDNETDEEGEQYGGFAEETGQRTVGVEKAGHHDHNPVRQETSLKQKTTQKEISKVAPAATEQSAPHNDNHFANPGLAASREDMTKLPDHQSSTRVDKKPHRGNYYLTGPELRDRFKPTRTDRSAMRTVILVLSMFLVGLVLVFGGICWKQRRDESMKQRHEGVKSSIDSRYSRGTNTIPMKSSHNSESSDSSGQMKSESLNSGVDKRCLNSCMSRDVAKPGSSPNLW